MANNIKGITIDIGGNTAPLSKALKDVDKTSRNLQSELREVNKQLKFDPTNTTLLAQKQKLLAESISNTKGKLTSLKEAERQVQEQFKQGKIGEEQYRALQREVIKTEQQLKNLEAQSLKSSNMLSQISTTADKVGHSAANISKKTAPATIAIGALGFKVVETGMEFESAMSRVKAISGSTSDEFEQLESAALSLGATTAFSAKEVAAAQESMASAGFKVNEIMEATPGVLDLAASSGEDLATASNIAAGAIRGFGLEASQSSHVADVLAKAAADTNAGVSSMGQSFSYVAPLARGVGWDIESVAAAVGAMADANIDGSTSGTVLRGAISRLANPSKEATGAMKDLAFNAFDISGKMKPLSSITDELSTSMIGLTDQQKQETISTIFGQEAMSGMMVLMQKGKPELDKLAEGFRNSDGSAKAMAETMLDNGKGSIDEMMGSIETASITLSTVLAPVITKIAEYISNLAQDFSGLSQGTQKTMLIVLALVAAIAPVAALISGIATIVGIVASVIATVSGAIGILTGSVVVATPAMTTLAGVITFITGPIGLTILAVMALVAGFVYLWKYCEGFRNFWIGLWNGIKESTAAVVNVLVEFFTIKIPGAFNATIAFIKNNWQGILLFIVNPFAGAFKLLYDNCNGFRTFINNLWLSIKATTESIWNGIKNFFTFIWTGIVTTVMSIITPFVLGITTIFNAMSGGMTFIFNGLKNYLEGIWNIIKLVILGPVILICDLCTGNFGKLKEDAVRIFTGLQQAFGQIWTGITQIFTGTLQAISGFLTLMWNSMVNIAMGIWNGFSNFMIGLWNSIVNNTVSAWNNLKNTVISIVAVLVQDAISTFIRILNFFANLPGNLYNLGVNMFTGLRNGMGSILSGLGSFVRSGFSHAISYITRLPREAYTWGVDFIEGLVKGIKSAAHAVGDAVQGVAQNIRSFLHFSVPDEGPLTDYETWMPDFMDGMAKGIKNSKHLVNNAIKNLAGDISVGMNLNPSMAGIGGINMGSSVKSDSEKSANTTINFNGSYSFNDHNDIDHFMNKAAILVKAKR